ncbi:hypothetical protein GCM10009744_32000 [Kribbella alba]|uniref:Uncharacterized protein n=1 Tax=Kribbella alba TaxID=190197 RepID=A0ABN2FC01_9ACTN
MQYAGDADPATRKLVDRSDTESTHPGGSQTKRPAVHRLDRPARAEKDSVGRRGHCTKVDPAAVEMDTA